MDDEEISFGRWVRRRRKALDLTQPELAERIGCSLSAIRKIEGDERRPSRQIAALLAEHLQIAPEERENFVKVARAELRVARLGQAVSSQMSGSFVTRFSGNQSDFASQPLITDKRRPIRGLPSPPTPFVGRQPELAALGKLLCDPLCRILTLTGPGGIGKTRLAIQIVSENPNLFPDGVFFVPLTAIDSPTLIPAAIARVLSFDFSGERPQGEELSEHLGEREALLILDNMEHLLPGAEVLAEIVRNSAHLKLLVTSVERLNLQGEWIFEISGLPSPEEDFTAYQSIQEYLAELEKNSAVALFIQIARRVRPFFELTRDNYACVTRICQLMEGFPLGIELAATWVRALSCQEIVDEIEGSPDFLTSSLKDIPARHRSLRAAFDHTWNLLTQEEADLLMHCTVFRGGFRRMAAAEVIQASPVQLSTLVDKSLLRISKDQRYELHEMIRRYAAERLSDHPEMYHRICSRHCTYYMQFIAEREGNLLRERVALEEIRDELANLRSAWEWGLAQADYAALSVGLDGLTEFYRLTGLLKEGTASLELAVDILRSSSLSNGEHKHLLGRLLVALSSILNDQAQTVLAAEVAQEVIALAAEIDDHALEMRGYLQWGLALRKREESETARLRLETALRMAELHNDSPVLAECLHELGRVSYLGRDFESAHTYFLRSVEIYRQCGDRRGESAVLNSLGNNYYLCGDLGQAKDHYLSALKIIADVGDRRGEGRTTNNLGAIFEVRGEFIRAREYYQKGYAIIAEIGDLWGESAGLSNLGMVSYRLGDFSTAWELNERAIQICRKIALRGGEVAGLSNLGLLAYQRGQLEKAIEYQKKALEKSEEHSPASIEALIMTRLGRVFLTMGDDIEAECSFDRALQRRQSEGRRELILEPLTGLAELHLLRKEVNAARKYADEAQQLLAQLDPIPLNEIDEPLWIYLVCYQVLLAADDLQAGAWLERGYHLLMSLAERIPTRSDRESFLSAFASHRQIIETHSLNQR